MADAGVLDRLQYRDVPGERGDEAARRLDREWAPPACCPEPWPCSGRSSPENLNMLIGGANFVAGAAWGCMLMSAISAALAIGDFRRGGKVVGLVFSALALGTFARMAAVAGGLQRLPEYAPLLHWAPVALLGPVAGAGLSGDRRRRGADRALTQPAAGLKEVPHPGGSIAKRCVSKEWATGLDGSRRRKRAPQP